ncbi:MAG: exosortase-associated protein EpsI, B-type [Aquabacterium sp.]|uniref:exosortase-associated protein EpsI, B-type n=1 Tax=Aquabacterium sp. TaxID=1872578 RepID=UPI003BD6AAEC
MAAGESTILARDGEAGALKAALLAVAVLMLGVALSYWWTPKRALADELPPLNLEQAVPERFGAWHLDPSVVPVLPDPTVERKVQSLYSATLSRTYLRDDGSRVMLTIAYGRNQNSESTAAHRPEFCYAAQGFVVNKTGVDAIKVQDHDLRVVRLMATAGMRYEPITYWVTLGRSASIPGVSRKLAQLKYGLQGWIMDGMLMRVSSLTPGADQADRNQAKLLHTQFINDLAHAMAPADRGRFFGSKEE